MKALASFKESQLNVEDMKNVKGGWYYGYSCTCGSTSFQGVGNLDQYRTTVGLECGSGTPVSCNFYQPN